MCQIFAGQAAFHNDDDTYQLLVTTLELQRLTNIDISGSQMLHEYYSRQSCLYSKFLEGKSSFLVTAGWHVGKTIKAVNFFLLRFAMYRTK